MKRVRDKRVLAIITMFILLSGTVLPVFSVRANNNAGKQVTKDNEDFTVETEYGIDGFAAYDNPAVVKVKVQSRYNFTGTLRITPVVDDGQKIVAYGEEISLAAGEAKTFTFIPSSLGNSGKVKVELLDEKEKTIYSESKQLTLVSIGTGVVIGVLSDDYSALNYFDGMPVNLDNYQGMSGTLELTKDSMPADSGALSVLNYIILDNFDTAQLSDEQYEALKEWVNNGGVLILALGGNYQNVLHRFTDDFITGTLGKLEKKDLEWNIYEPGAVQGIVGDETEDEVWETDQEETPEADIKQETISSEESQAVTGLSIPNVDSMDFLFTGASNLSDFSNDGTAYQKNMGAGNVVVLSYALSMEPIASSPFKGDIAQLLLQTSAVAATSERLNGSGYGMGGWYRGTNLAKMADRSKKPSVILYGGILFVYVIWVGPVLYLILKAVKKREKIWIAIPIVAFAFTGIIYLTGFIYRVSKPLVNTFFLISVEDGFKTEKVYTNIMCPKAQKYTVRIKEGYTDFQYNLDGYYDYSIFGSNSSGKQFDYMISKKSDGTEIVLNNDETFEDTSFAVKKTSENDIGTIECDLKCYTTGFEGTITNNTEYDLTGVVVTFERYFYQAGDMKKGEQVKIDSSKMIESTGYGVFDWVYDGVNLYSNSNSKLYTQYQIDSSMENSFIDIKECNRGYIWAGVDSYKPDFVEETEVKHSSIGVLFQTYTAEYEDVEDVYYPSLEPMEVSSQGEYDGADGMIYGNGTVTITYSFENYQGITTLENLSYGKEPQSVYYNSCYANIYAYNPETGAYDLVFETDAVLSGNDLKKYMSGNVIVLKYEVPDTEYNAYMPRIIARGDK